MYADDTGYNRRCDKSFMDSNYFLAHMRQTPVGIAHALGTAANRPHYQTVETRDHVYPFSQVMVFAIFL